MPDDALDTDDEAVDPSFDLDSSVRSDTDHIVETFWVCHLDMDDRVSLGLFLCFQLSKYSQLGETKAAELSGMMIGKSDRAIQEWRAYFNDYPREQAGEIRTNDLELFGIMKPEQESHQVHMRTCKSQRAT